MPASIWTCALTVTSLLLALPALAAPPATAPRSSANPAKAMRNAIKRATRAQRAAARMQVNAVRRQRAVMQRAGAGARARSRVGGTARPTPAPAPLAAPVAVAAPAAPAGASIPWSQLSGRPTVEAGSKAGYWIWRENATVYLSTTCAVKSGGVTFTGEGVMDGGTIAYARGIDTEAGDVITSPEPGRVTFKLITGNQTDTVCFDVAGGRTLTLTLKVGGKGALAERIYIGAKQMPVTGNPLVVDLTR
jgi:hypothetical protein